jgi:hypothetical protein
VQRGAGIVLLSAVGLFSPPAWSVDNVPADARGERLAMPYSCAVEQGTLVVRPGPERTFRVAGGVERRLVTKCDPPFSNNCMSITVYRFDVMCGTERVSWPRLVASIGRTSAGQASLAKGHLVLERAATTTSGNAPSCSEMKPAMGVGMPGECLPWRVARPMDQIVLPQGFAPVREVGARLVAGQAPSEWAAANIMSSGRQSPAGNVVALPAPRAESSSMAPAVSREVASGMTLADLAQPPQSFNGGWSTSLSVYTGEPPAPEFIAIGGEDLSPHAATLESSAAPSVSIFAWLAVLGGLGLAGAYMARSEHMRLAAPFVSSVWSGTRRQTRKVQERSLQALDQVRSRLIPQPAPAYSETDDDPTLAGALLQLKAMLARTEAAVSMHSSTAVLREVMQADLTAIRRRLEDAEEAARTGSAPLMKIAGQFRQIGRDIERVQRISESAAQSFQSKT